MGPIWAEGRVDPFTKYRLHFGILCPLPTLTPKPFILKLITPKPKPYKHLAYIYPIIVLSISHTYILYNPCPASP